MSLQLTSGSGERTFFEAAFWLNWRTKNLTLLSYGYCITGISKPVGTPNINFKTYYTRGDFYKKIAANDMTSAATWNIATL